MANKKHSGQLLKDTGLATSASYKTAWIIGLNFFFNWRDDENIITLVMESFLVNV